VYYTYSHSTPEGTVFYIGKGNKDRAYSTRDRGWAWREAVAKAKGILIKIEAEWATEQEAFEHEIFLIKHHKELGVKLVNLTEGGSGPLGFKQSEKTRALMKEKMTGYVHKEITCPHCNTTGGETSMKRWHFNNCTGSKEFRSRITVLGKRIYLGYYGTKELASSVAKEFYDFVMQEASHLNKLKGIQ
jgi:hypothetical protein